MKVRLVNIVLSLFLNEKLKNIKNILDLRIKELRLSYSQLNYALKKGNINYYIKNFNILKKFPKGKKILTKFF